MFEHLSDRFRKAVKNIRGEIINEKTVDKNLRDIKKILLTADVAVSVVDDFTQKIRDRAIGREVLGKINASQAFIKIVHEGLIRILGEAVVPLNLKVEPPAVLLMAGLQGTGKTTSAVKLARYLRDQDKKKVLVVSTDIRRPAAIDQLQKLAEDADIDFFPSTPDQNVLDIVKNAKQHAKLQFFDVLIIDTAGRLHIDEAMMQEIKQIHQLATPVETLYVIDCMVGQDAVNTAKVFGETLPITGVILTKLDGDARGGAALSVSHVTGTPIKFMGTGEKTDALEIFHPDRIASRILGKGDILSLVEAAERSLGEEEKEKSKKLATKVSKGKAMNFEDLRDQLMQIDKIGGFANILDKMPMMGNFTQMAKDNINSGVTASTTAIINSMTPKERRNPSLLQEGANARSRIERIVKGCGRKKEEVRRLIKQLEQMQKMMKKFGKPGAMKNMMRRFLT